VTACLLPPSPSTPRSYLLYLIPSTWIQQALPNLTFGRIHLEHLLNRISLLFRLGILLLSNCPAICAFQQAFQVIPAFKKGWKILRRCMWLWKLISESFLVWKQFCVIFNSIALESC
jgi:hypothetical protein